MPNEGIATALTQRSGREGQEAGQGPMHIAVRIQARVLCEDASRGVPPADQYGVAVTGGECTADGLCGGENRRQRRRVHCELRVQPPVNAVGDGFRSRIHCARGRRRALHLRLRIFSRSRCLGGDAPLQRFHLLGLTTALKERLRSSAANYSGAVHRWERCGRRLQMPVTGVGVPTCGGDGDGVLLVGGERGVRSVIGVEVEGLRNGVQTARSVMRWHGHVAVVLGGSLRHLHVRSQPVSIGRVHMVWLLD